jgi:hypothetical protein
MGAQCKEGNKKGFERPVSLQWKYSKTIEEAMQGYREKQLALIETGGRINLRVNKSCQKRVFNG